MRFLENGADIPNDLIRAVNDGTVTFLCGAGVSLGAGLPLFEGLTESVYQRLGESWKGEAAERRAIENKEFDRALRSLGSGLFDQSQKATAAATQIAEK
jgi:hypothetical protein